MKKVRYSRPKLATMSPMPAFYNLPETVQMYNSVVRNLPERVERGRYLFLLMMAGFLRDRLKIRAPEVFLNGQPTKYAQDLRIALLSGTGSDMDAVAIYFENQRAVLNEKDVGRTALYVRAHGQSPGWVSVMTKWGPWPADLLPVKLAANDAKVVSRRARPDEIKALTDRLTKRSQEILAELLKAGAPNPTMEKTAKGVGTEVCEDIAFAVLRKEFGMDGEQPKAHWRPAFNELMAAMPDAVARFNKYLLTGRENVFQLPDVDGNITMGQLRDGAAFTNELAPFVPQR